MRIHFSREGPNVLIAKEPAFLADEMLGRLARWLRILGYDTGYAHGMNDEEILEQAELQGRIILTRDTLLIRRRRCPNYIFIKSDHWREQLQQVYVEADLNTERAFSLCPVCNYPLNSVDRESLQTSVPSYVYQTQRTFSRCALCGRIYWAATHVDRILDELKALRKEH